MPLFKFAWGIFQSILAFAIVALSVEFYNDALLPVDLPEIVSDIALFAVAIVPLFWILVHFLGGSVLSAAGSGGFWEGAKMGVLLGVGTGVSRLWPHTTAWSVGCFAANGPGLHIGLLVFITLLLLAMNHAIKFFWSGVRNANMHG